MKIGFDLTLNQRKHDGITRYSIEIINRLIGMGDNDYTGYAFAPYFRKKKLESFYKKLYPQLDTRISNSGMPSKCRVFAYYKPCVLSSKNSILKNDNDVMVYFYNAIHRCKTKAKKVVVIHDIIPLYDVSLSFSSIIRIKRCKKAVKYSDVIITDSEFSKREILKYFPEAKDKIKVIYCGVDTEPYKKQISDEKYAEVKKKYNLEKEYIFFIGQARENKNLVNLIKAYNLLPEGIKKDYDLVLANSNEKLENLVKELNIGGSVKLLHGFAEEDKAALLKGSSALCLVSTMEGFGLPMVEAMAAGVPVVASNVSCLPEVAGDAAQLVDPYDLNDIAQGIENVLTDGRLREQFIEKGYKRAESFSWDNAAEAFAAELKLLQS